MIRMFIFNTIFFLVLTLSVHANAVCVKVPEANLRSGPGTRYEKTWEVFKYMPFKKIGEKGNWYNVEDVDGDEHWIYKKLITNKFNCAVVKVDEANFRKGPGINFGKNHSSPLIKYESFKVLKRKGKWVNVVNEFGDAGWIYRKLLWIY